MFNLLVGVDPGDRRLSADRVLVEYTDEALRHRFKPDGELDLEVARFPALVMPEIGAPSRSLQVARVARLVEVSSQNGGFVSFRTIPDDAIPPIPIKPELWEMRSSLKIEDTFEFSRTHWALKEADLFEVLLHYHLKQLPVPRILGVERLEPIDRDQVSVMMRFRPDFDQVFEAIRAAAKAAGFKCHRVKDIWEKDAIISDIAGLIMRSRVVIADLTDKNSNVFYESGLAHGMGRDVIPITQDAAGSFDVQHLRHIVYTNTEEGREALSKELQTRLEALRGIET